MKKNFKPAKKSTREKESRKTSRKVRGLRPSGHLVSDEVVRPAVGTLARTKSLLLAALRVWELKNGYPTRGR